VKRGLINNPCVGARRRRRRRRRRARRDRRETTTRSVLFGVLSTRKPTVVVAQAHTGTPSRTRCTDRAFIRADIHSRGASESVRGFRARDVDRLAFDGARGTYVISDLRGKKYIRRVVESSRRRGCARARAGRGVDDDDDDANHARAWVSYLALSTMDGCGRRGGVRARDGRASGCARKFFASCVARVTARHARAWRRRYARRRARWQCAARWVVGDISPVG